MVTLLSSAQAAATRRLATMIAPKMIFPGPKRINGLVSGSCLYFPFNPSQKGLQKRVMHLKEDGVVGAIRLKFTKEMDQGPGLSERE